MSQYPKWKYRKHPEEGFFQQTLVLHKEAEDALLAEAPDWSDDPKSTGFEVRPAAQMHHSHFTPGAVLHEVVTGEKGEPLEAQIEVTLQGDKSHG